MKSIYNIKSPMKIDRPAKDSCCEMIIYDNDGPEGIFMRIRAERSSDLIKLIFDNISSTEELKDLNFEIVNHWKRPAVEVS